MAEEKVERVNDDNAIIQQGNQAFEKDQEIKPVTVRIICAEAQGKIAGKAEIEGRGKIKEHRLKIEKGTAQALGVAGQTVQPEKIQREKEDDSQHHHDGKQNGK